MQYRLTITMTINRTATKRTKENGGIMCRPCEFREKVEQCIAYRL